MSSPQRPARRTPDCWLHTSGFESKYNVRVDVVAVGSGQAIELRRGDADIVLSHAPSLEEPFVSTATGCSGGRSCTTVRDSGAPDDPAGATATTHDGFSRIGPTRPLSFAIGQFGTYVKELRYGSGRAGPSRSGMVQGVGKGMEETLQMARRCRLHINRRGDIFRDQTGVPRSCSGTTACSTSTASYPLTLTSPIVNIRHSIFFAEWLVNPGTQDMIASYTKNGRQLFYPNALPP